jgi:hypothetical protein
MNTYIVELRGIRSIRKQKVEADCVEIGQGFVKFTGRQAEHALSVELAWFATIDVISVRKVK